MCSQPPYLLRETAEELVQELGEDETDILWKGKRRGVRVSADLVGTVSIDAERRLHLVEEVLNKFGDAYVVVVSMDEQHLLEVLELRDGVVTVPHSLAALLAHYT